MSNSRSERVKKNLLKQVGKPPSICSKHKVLKTRNPGGSQICKLCNKERAKERLTKRIESGISPSVCPRCKGERAWDTFGRAKCKPCSNAFVSDWKTANPEAFKESQRKHYKINKDEILRKNKEYIEANIERVRQMRLDYVNRHDREYWVWRSMNDRCYNHNHRQYKDWGGRGVEIYEGWRRDPSISKQNNMLKYNTYKSYIENNLGPRPSADHSIDRIDNNGNYEPGNLKWSTREEQVNNQRRSIAVKLSILDNSPIYYPFGNLITLIEFSRQVGLPLIVAKYRYSHNPDAEWILDSTIEGRYYEYQGHKYNMAEMVAMSGINFHTLSGRIHRLNWSISKALETPVH